MTALLIFDPIKNSISVKQRPRTQFEHLTACQISWQIDDSRPDKKGCCRMVCAILNDEASLVSHNALEQEISLSKQQNCREKDVSTCSNFMWDRIAPSWEINHY